MTDGRLETAPDASVVVAAVDLGATSGRVMLGRVASGSDGSAASLELDEVARFPNEPVHRADGLHWDIHALREAVLDGLADAQASAARAGERIASIGIDSWAVDYGVLRGGELVGEPFHYRDDRNARGVASVHAIVPFDRLYARNGLQFLPFNTLYQLAADPAVTRYEDAYAGGDGIALIADLFSYWLTGVRVAEETNASTTGLVPAAEPEPRWDAELAERIGVPAGILPPIVRPGTVIGTITPEVAARTGLPTSTPVVAVGSHDTASAVVATPFGAEGSAFVSCGTWGLVGVESPTPVLTAEARDAGFTNERGVDGTTRLLHNVMGLWVLNECVRAWHEQDTADARDAADLPLLLEAAVDPHARWTVFDIDDPRLLPPGDMPGRVEQLCREAGDHVPRSRPEIMRSIVESLAEAFARAAAQASALAGTPLAAIDIVGGGARNALLCQSTADRAGVPVVAGSVEATALGNVLVQARAAGAVTGELSDLRRLVATTQATVRYEPR
jgi:rhamnulokinase